VLIPGSQTAKIKFMEAEIKQVADIVTANILFYKKEVLTSDEAAKYMGISKSYLYKLTMRQQIPHFKPMGKMCYFNRTELEQWLQNNKVTTLKEISQQAQTHCMQKGGKHDNR
jgi:excisionase family DNA binding protein